DARNATLDGAPAPPTCPSRYGAAGNSWREGAMISRLFVAICVGAASLGAVPAVAAPPAAGTSPSATPQGTIQAFYDQLVAVMKEGKTLGMAGRFEKLLPALGHAYDLPAMTRFAVGPQWNQLSPDEQEKLVVAFKRFTAANYARNF